MGVKLEVPSFGESITEVVIDEWLVEEGQQVEVDQPVVSIESDKATLEVPAPTSGVLTKILKRAGEEATVGEVIAELDTDATATASAPSTSKSEPSKAAPKKTAPKKTAPPKAEPAQPKPDKASSPGDSSSSDGATSDVPMGPAVRRMVESRDLDPTDIDASGRRGRLLKEDVQRHLKRDAERTQSQQQKAPAAQAERPEPAPDRPERTVPMSPIRKVIARRLVQASQSTAMLTTFNEIDMTRVMELRQAYKASFQEKHGIKLGFMSFFVKAAVSALQAYPNVNGEVADQSIVYKDYYDVGVAVGSGKGLTVPVIRAADRLSFAEIEQTIRDFAVRAQQNRLKLDELQGGTFTISNGGIYGSMLSTPILNPPQSGILGMHNILQRPMVLDGNIVARPMMYVALTYDHRIVDGREAVGFLLRVKEAVENPERLLLEV